MDTIELIKDKVNNSYLPNFDENDYYPTVSVVTPTYNRDHLIDIAIFNWQNFIYPPEKMEWIILDDSYKESIKNFKKKLPKNDKRIKYYTCKKIDTIGKKRNKLNELANNEVIIHMDDDDYYPPDSIINRVRSLLTYKKKCVGCSAVNCINLLDNTCFKTSGGFRDNTIITAEASLAYYKSFWEEQKYDDFTNSEECKKFLENRNTDYIDLNSAFIMIAITHSKNMSDRVLKNTINRFNFFDELPVNVVNILEKLQNVIHSKLPGVSESIDFIKSNYGKPNDIILNKIKMLPVEIVSTNVMSCYIEELSSQESILADSVYALYYPGTFYRNIKSISKNNYNDLFLQSIKFLNYYFPNKNIKLYAYTFQEFKIDSIEVIPWYYFNKKCAADTMIIIEEYSHFDIIKNMSHNKIIYLNLSNENTIYKNNFLESLDSYYTFGNKNYILFHNIIKSKIKAINIKYFYLGKGEEIKNNRVFLDINYEGDLSNYKSIHTHGDSLISLKNIQKDNNMDCEYCITNNFKVSFLSYIISKGIKYLSIEDTKESLDLGILKVTDTIPNNYFEILHDKIKSLLKII